jgi:hypothetical protein
MRQVANFSILIMATLLTACAIIPEPRRASEGKPVTMSSVMLAEHSEADGPELAIVRKAIAQSLQSKGIEITRMSDVEIDGTLSRRPPTVALFAKSDEKGSNSSVSGDSRSTRLDLCKDAIVRLSVSIVNVKTGEQLYRAHAEDQTCRPLTEPLIGSLAKEALAGLKLTY